MTWWIVKDPPENWENLLVKRTKLSLIKQSVRPSKEQLETC